MNARYMLLITWVLLIIISISCWQSYQQLGRAQHQIQTLEVQLDSLKTTVNKYYTLQFAYAEIHQALSTSHEQLSQIGDHLQDNTADQLGTLINIKQQLDSIQLAYDTLSSYALPQMNPQDLSFTP